MQENVSYSVQSAERRSYIGAYSPPVLSLKVAHGVSEAGGEGGGKIVLVEEVDHIVGGNRVATVVDFCRGGLCYGKFVTRMGSDGIDLANLFWFNFIFLPW